jgi:hypothetical protein
VRSRGLEPPWIAPLVPETSASAISPRALIDNQRLYRFSLNPFHGLVSQIPELRTKSVKNKTENPESKTSFVVGGDHTKQGFTSTARKRGFLGKAFPADATESRIRVS